MSTHQQRSASKERFWRGVLRQWRGSGLSVRAFCRRQGLGEPNFYAWRRTLAERDAAAVRFVPVRVRPANVNTASATSATAKAGTEKLAADDPAPANPAPAHPATHDSAAGAVEVLLRAGRRLRVAPGFDEATLRRLLSLLEEGRP